jgi:subtilisin family serine protease
MQILEKLPIGKYKYIQFNNRPIIDLYSSIESFLRAHFDPIYIDQIAQVQTSTKDIQWQTNKIGQYKTLDNFVLSTQLEIKQKYNLFVRAIHEQLNSWEGQEEFQEWRKIILEVFNYDKNIIYTNGNDFVVVWGLDFNNKTENYLEDHLIFKEPLNKTEQVEIEPEEKTTVEKAKSIELGKTKNEITASQIIIRSNKKPRTRNLFVLLGLGIFNLLKDYWLLFIVLFIIFFLFLGYKSFNGKELNWTEIKDRHLPEREAEIVPIDTAKLIFDDDSKQKIVSDRINIALKDKDKNLEKFIVDFFAEFVDTNKYKITYYDLASLRIQVQYPEIERATIKNKIKEEMSSYNLLIWDESIFSSSAVFSEPDFQENEKSWYFNSTQAYEAWDITSGSADVIIAIIDDGFDLRHNELNGNIFKPYNVTSKSDRVFGNENIIHGTHVSSIAIGKNNNNSGLSGIAPKCRFMPVQIGDANGTLSSTNIIDGILYAIKNGAKVINLSLGKMLSNEITNLTEPEIDQLVATTGKDEELFWHELFKYADSEGTAIVIAAGNQNFRIGIDPMTRSKYAIKVEAIDVNFKKANFSNYGNIMSISAPGQHIYSALPNGSFGYLDGTSMAAPIVAGTIGLMKSIAPNLKIADIYNILYKTGVKTNNSNIGPVLQIKKALLALRAQ